MPKSHQKRSKRTSRPGIHLWLDYSGSNDRPQLHVETFEAAARISIANGTDLVITCFTHVLGEHHRLTPKKLAKAAAQDELPELLQRLLRRQPCGGTDFQLVWENALVENEGNPNNVMHVVSTDYEWFPPLDDPSLQHPENLGYIGVRRPSTEHVSAPLDTWRKDFFSSMHKAMPGVNIVLDHSGESFEQIYDALINTARR